VRAWSDRLALERLGGRFLTRLCGSRRRWLDCGRDGWIADRVRANASDALIDGRLIVTWRAMDLFDLPNDTRVLAHWHGQ